MILSHAISQEPLQCCVVPPAQLFPLEVLASQHFLLSGNRAEFLMPDLQIPLSVSTNTITFHHLLKPQGIHREINHLCILTVTPNHSPFLGYICFPHFTTIPKSMKTGPDSNVKLQEKKKLFKSVKTPSLSHMNYESLNAMQYFPNAFDCGKLFLGHLVGESSNDCSLGSNGLEGVYDLLQ